jgi:hypothetical protein
VRLHRRKIRGFVGRCTVFGVLLTVGQLTDLQSFAGEDTSMSDTNVDSEAAVWRLSDEYVASRGDERLAVYVDPINERNLLLWSSERCILVNLDIESVTYPSCALFSEQRIDHSGLELNRTLMAQEVNSPRDVVPGKPWVDVQMDCGAYVSVMFRRPRFWDGRVRFWDCREWVRLEAAEDGPSLEMSVPNGKGSS